MHMSEARKRPEQEIGEAAERCRNWGRWGADDEAGCLNYVTADKIVAAARCVRSGKVFSLAVPFDHRGPQRGVGRRFNPIHTMLADGSDVIASETPLANGVGFSDDAVHMPLQCGTQWDALSHVFDRGKMWNGYGAGEVTSRGAARNGIEKVRNRMVGRGVLLDIARYKNLDSLEPGYAISSDDLDGCIARQGKSSQVSEGDFLLVRTGQMGHCKKNGWGSYAGGDAPGLSFYAADWLHRSRIAAIVTDTWGMEVRPNELANSFQPLHQVVIPNMGLTIGEIWDLEDLAADCASDGIYEFMLVAPPLPITGAVGSPVNPQAIK
jgi:kynurenine formamidase